MPELHPPLKCQSQQTQTIGRFGGIDLYDSKNSWSPAHWGFGEVAKSSELLAEFQRLTNTILEYRDQFDVSVAVYHQLVDLEDETNGLVTYNRERLKVPPEEIKKQLDKLDFP